MEIWKNIIGYENYQVSNFGNVKSLKWNKEKFLKFSIDAYGYFIVGLSDKGKDKTRTVHQLVAEAFLRHSPCGYRLIINHIDFNRQNNRVENLEIVTARENCNKKHIKSSSIYTGVSWHKNRNKWIASILINKKSKHLGYFINEYDAHLAYENELKLISLENG